VIDVWFEDTVKRHCRGEVKLFRYCDDAVICCQNVKDAIRIRTALAKRLARFKLKLNEEKTHLVAYSKWEYLRGHKQGTFDFLGFTFYWGRTRNGAMMIPKLKTSGKRMQAKLKRVKAWVRGVKDSYPLNELWKVFCSKLLGHIRYYGVTHNSRRVKAFQWQAVRIVFKWLNRRSQRKSFTWEKFWRFVERNPLPKVKLYHSIAGNLS
jgi:RNA-directed DNA polymerase